jgi:hypothetical protein
MNSLRHKSELALVKAQNIDITNFEEGLAVHPDQRGLSLGVVGVALCRLQSVPGWGKNYCRAHAYPGISLILVYAAMRILSATLAAATLLAASLQPSRPH